MFYEHAKYNMANFDPDELIPSEYREKFKHNFDSLSNIYKGWGITQIAQHFKAEGIFSFEQSKNLIEVDGIIQELSSGTKDFKATILEIELLTNSKVKDVVVSCTDKESIVLINSIIKGSLLYLDELGLFENSDLNGSQIQERGCVFGDIFCIISLTAVSAVSGGLGGIFVSIPLIPVLDGIYRETGFDPSFVLINAGAIVGGLYGLYSALQLGGPCCALDYDCRPVSGLSLRFTNCSASATYKTWAYGADDVSLDWTNVGGTPATTNTMLNGVNNASLLVTQNAGAASVLTTIVSNCVDGSTNTRTFNRDLSLLVRSVVGIALTGPTKVYSPLGESHYYSGIGLSLNPNYSAEWEATNGTVENSNNFGTFVVWDSDLEEGELRLIVTNNCPNGNSRQYTLKVTGDGEIP